MSRSAKINALLLLVVAALAVLPLALGLGDHKEEPFAGADAEAETAVTEIQPDYEPWFSPLYEPPSGEIESALFALQAALGAGVLAYYFGVRRGRRQGQLLAPAPQDGQDDGHTPGTSTSGPPPDGSPASGAAGVQGGTTAAPRGITASTPSGSTPADGGGTGDSAVGRT